MNNENRALARQGHAYLKKDDLDQAAVTLGKSLSEHREPAVVKEVQEVCAYRILKLTRADRYYRLSRSSVGRAGITVKREYLNGNQCIIFKRSRLERYCKLQ